MTCACGGTFCSSCFGHGVLALEQFLEIVNHPFLYLHPLGGAVEVLGVDEEGPPP